MVNLEIDEIEITAEVKDISDSSGLSPWQLGMRRFRKGRLGVIALGVVLFYVLVAIFAPLIVRLLNVDPYALDRQAINDFGLPKGPLGSMSWNHPLGVEPGTGRDILGRLIYGTRLSLIIGTVGTVLSTTVGVCLGIVAGLRRGWVDSLISRIGDVALAFPSLLLIIALANPMTQRLESWGVPKGNTAKLTYILTILTIFGWVYMA